MNNYFHILDRTLNKIEDERNGGKENTFHISPEIINHAKSLFSKFENTKLGAYYKELLGVDFKKDVPDERRWLLEKEVLEKFNTLNKDERKVWAKEMVVFYIEMLSPLIGCGIGKTSKKNVFENKAIERLKGGKVALFESSPSAAKGGLFVFHKIETNYPNVTEKYHMVKMMKTGFLLNHLLGGYRYIEDADFVVWRETIFKQVYAEIRKKEKAFLHKFLTTLSSLEEYKKFKAIFLLKGKTHRNFQVSLWNRFVQNKEKLLQLYSEDPVRLPKVIKMIDILESRTETFLNGLFTDNYMKEARDFLKKKGLSDAGWKKGILEVPNAILLKPLNKLSMLEVLLPILDGHTDLSAIFDFFKKEVDRDKIDIAVYKIAKFNIKFEKRITNLEEAQEFIKEFSAFSEKIPKIRRLVLENISLKDGWQATDELFDFLDGAGNGVYQSLPPASQLTWKGLQRRQKDWHEIMLTQKMNERSSQVWESAIRDAVSVGDFTAHPLTDGGMLYKEGKEMHHCVASYSERCVKGRIRIFKITDKEGVSVGTLEIADKNDGWEVTQFRGYCNQNVKNEKALEFVNDVAKQYTVAQKKQLRLQEKRDIKVKSNTKKPVEKIMDMVNIF